MRSRATAVGITSAMKPPCRPEIPPTAEGGAPELLQPRHADLPEGSDPAELVATGRTRQLLDALDHARPLADALIEERLTNLPPAEATLAAATVIAAQPVEAWEPSIHTVAEQVGVDADVIRTTVRVETPRACC